MTIADLLIEYRAQATAIQAEALAFPEHSPERAEAVAREDTWTQAADRLAPFVDEWTALQTQLEVATARVIQLETSVDFLRDLVDRQGPVDAALDRRRVCPVCRQHFLPAADPQEERP